MPAMLLPGPAPVTTVRPLRRNPASAYPEPVESVMLDPVDRGLLHALQIDGRAPFARIAEVLDVSDRTVARRYARLRAHGLLRVTGVPDSQSLGYSEWLVRVRVRPGAAAGVAQALARRPDTAWVSTLSSGAELAAIFRIPDDGAAPLDLLARHQGITAVDAQLLLPLTTDRWRGRTAALTPAQIDALRTGSAELTPISRLSGRLASAHAPRVLALTELDRRLLPALALDGRAGYPSLSRAVGWSESAVRRRLEELRHNRILRFDVEVAATAFGFRAQAALWLAVTPARVAAVAAQLAEHRETAFVGATTGEHNLIAIVVCHDAPALFRYLNTTVAALDGIERVESAVITGIAKRSAPPWEHSS
ncbi:Lrp/AsnC family transcriptional regulator [Nocardia huaxiensis]|uniref:Lrp/AsnC family transcriptional regulator n=1 Tax=Nocardia huaxiensis TaxID=2755382 RepID=UPI001E659DBD|nr:AsnC family transcriptional regulator [Nocardia huaxiensis]UFS98578.1 AsnC family transcriptional regulator [Nocardia huaxiensis]